MCGTDQQGHDHTHDHEHGDDHGHHCCSYGEDYERNLAEARAHARRGNVTRRQVLRGIGAAGLLIAGGGIAAGGAFAADPRTGRPLAVRAYRPQGADEFDGYYFLSGDHHIHTRYSSDAKYAVQRQVAEAHYHGLDWMVITDHGSAAHNKISVDLTYPDVVGARDAFKEMLLFTGLEMNIPGAEHGTVMMLPTAKERDQIKAFELAYDGAIVTSTEEKAQEGLRYLQGLDPRPLFFANHPARRGLDSPHEIRAWKAAGPDVAYGFEGAPGHQAAGLIRDREGKIVSYRGFYGNTPEAGAWPGYPLEAYFTYGGFDWMTATLGGLWDALLGDGIRWWITANSDAHKYFNDLQDVDNKEFNTLGYVKEVDRYFQQPTYGDFRPGEYSRTYAVTQERSYAAVMDSLRAGRMFVVQGDLIDALKFTAASDGAEVMIGGTLEVAAGADVLVTIKARVPAAANAHHDRPAVDHIDLIAGDINNLSRTAGQDNFVNPSTRVVETFQQGYWDEQFGPDGLTITIYYRFEGVTGDFYIRLRGTNTDDRGATPAMDADQRGQIVEPNSPWDSLWFYANPIFVKVS